VKLLLTHGDFAADKDAVPRDLHVIEIENRVILIETAAIILFTQPHDDEMATRREQITLELAILSEQKSAKIIALLEEFHRNDPNQGDYRDEVAEALAQPADPQVVLDAIRAAEKAEDRD
jgi:uncharacterized membrane protein